MHRRYKIYACQSSNKWGIGDIPGCLTNYSGTVKPFIVKKMTSANWLTLSEKIKLRDYSVNEEAFYQDLGHLVQQC